MASKTAWQKLKEIPLWEWHVLAWRCGAVGLLEMLGQTAICYEDNTWQNPTQLMGWSIFTVCMLVAILLTRSELWEWLRKCRRSKRDPR